MEKVGITQLGRTGIVYLSDKDDFVGVEDMVKSANFYMTLNKAIGLFAGAVNPGELEFFYSRALTGAYA